MQVLQLIIEYPDNGVASKIMFIDVLVDISKFINNIVLYGKFYSFINHRGYWDLSREYCKRWKRETSHWWIDDEEDRGIEEVQEGIRDDVDVRSFNSKFITPEKSPNLNKEIGSPESNEIENVRALSSLNIRNPFNQAYF